MKTLYKKLGMEYLMAINDPSGNFLENNPVKQSIVLEETKEGNPDKFLNIMSAKLSNGTSGAKVIHVDESTGNMSSFTILYGKDGTPKIVESVDLTRLRCALMAAMSIDLFFKDSVDLSQLRVGFIGLGRMNLKTMEVLKELFGTDNFVGMGSPMNRAKNLGKFARVGSIVMSSEESGYTSLKNCDVVISCTNTTDPNHTIEYGELKGPKLFIAQDGGYIFGPSFRRNCVSFSDYPAQLLSAAEHEFPWDGTPPFEVFPLSKLVEFNNESKYGRVAYLYGIALADLVVAGGLDG